MGLAGGLLNAVLICAVFRAVLHPEDRRWSYMRIGTTELIVFAMFFAIPIALVIAILTVMIPVGLIVAVIGVAGSPAGAAGFAVIAGVLAAGAMVYFALRLVFIGPMIVDDGQLRLGEAWRLSKGRVGGLFLIGLIVFLILGIGEIVLFTICTGLFVASVGGFDQFTGFFQLAPAVIFARLTPVIIVGGLAGLIFVACVLPIFYAPWARAYRDLKGSDMQATFS